MIIASDLGAPGLDFQTWDSELPERTKLGGSHNLIKLGCPRPLALGTGERKSTSTPNRGGNRVVPRPIRYPDSAMPSPDDFRGKWALVTGASAGIGAAIAHQLASHGANLILTARRRERIESLAAHLAAEFKTETRIVAADLNSPNAPQQIYDATEGAGLTVDILINNAGLGHYGEFYKIDPEQEYSMVRVNCEAIVRLSRLFIPRMVERRRGWMLVVASTASFQPIPYDAVYAATKVFDRFFALALAEEVERFGIKITALCPGTTETEFFDVSGGGGVFRRFGGMQSSDEVARKAILALARGQRTIVPKFKAALVAFLVRFVPTRRITRTLERALRPKD
jgi:short-subunit dehydrogenase